MSRLRGAVRERAHAAARLVAFVFALVLVAGNLSACANENRLTVHTQKGDTTFSVEVADTPAEREKGLMYRTGLAPDAGMLFDFHAEQKVAFWMQNTLIPLDMIFISADGVVRNIHANAHPEDPTAIPSDGPVRFVLEIAGGRAAQIGLEPGDTISYPRIAAK